jgi:DNA-binding NtrC family response regulator
MAKVLLVDDEESLLEVLRTAMVEEGYEVEATTRPEEAVKMIHNDNVDAVIADLKMKPIDGIQVLREAKRADSNIAVIMITAFASIETAVEAMKEGAFDYIIKPFKMDEMRVALKRALAHRNLVKENICLKRELAGMYRFENIVGTSEVMQRLFRKVEKVAITDSTVLIYGESGTGKELVARALHYNSPRRDKPFVAVSCGAIPETLLESELFGHVKGAFTGAVMNRDGLFRAAEGGTIFLDEIGTMSLAVQASLLRVLQEREMRPVGASKSVKVNVRVIAASNERLEERIKNKSFREDLYYRLSVIPIDLPPLRERREDIPLLAEHFLKRSLAKQSRGIEVKLSPEVMHILTSYDWPGNVRELENVIERVIALGDGGIIKPAHLPEKLLEVGDHTANLREFVQQKEKTHIERILAETGGDKKKAAKIMGIDLATLYRKLDRFKNTPT